MGGYGSGKRWGSKYTTNDYKQVDVRYLKRKGWLQCNSWISLNWTRRGEPSGNINFRAEADRIILSYRHQSRGEDWKSEEYPVFLERTLCHMGGERTWFRCPARGCGRRVAILYGGTIFACRKCHGLAYETQHEGVSARADSRAWKIRKRCGDDDGGLFDPVFRPKGMHHRTFEKLEREYNRSTYMSFSRFANRTGSG